MRYLFAILILFSSTKAVSQEPNHRFKSGESLTYSIYYYLMGIWVGAGEVTFSVNQTELNGNPCFEFKGYGTTYPRYDWFYKVEDTYTSYSGIKDLKPYHFQRQVNEGGDSFFEKNVYDHTRNKIYTSIKPAGEPIVKDTIALKKGSLDVLTLLYHTRNLDFSSYEVGQKIPIKMVIEGEIFELYIRYLGTEIYEHDVIGKVDCYVFSALLVDGTIFKGGENMKVWVTRDENVIPIYVQSEIKVGSIRSELKAYSGIKSGQIAAKP